MDFYNEDYFERGIESGTSCYTNYRWIPELTIPLCDSIVEWTKSCYFVSSINKQSFILDFGCAKGFLVKGFRLLHYENCFGVDVSRYAISSCPSDVKKYVSVIGQDLDISVEKIAKDYKKTIWDWVICKDVLEHIDDEELDDVLLKFKSTSRHVVVIVPLGDGEKFNVPAYEFDKSHKTRQSASWWNKRFVKNRFCVSSESTRVKNVKENYSQYENGNGFFLLTS